MPRIAVGMAPATLYFYCLLSTVFCLLFFRRRHQPSDIVTEAVPRRAKLEGSGVAICGWKARPIGRLKPEANVETVPLGVTSLIVVELALATYRLPLLSKARPDALVNPEAKVETEPPGVTS